MLKNIALLTFSLTCFLQIGCASTKQHIPAAAAETETSVGKTKLVLLRPNKLYASAIPLKVYDSKTLVGTLGPGGMLIWERQPGFTTLEAKISQMGHNQAASKQLYADEGNAYWLILDISRDGLNMRIEFKPTENGRTDGATSIPCKE